MFQRNHAIVSVLLVTTLMMAHCGRHPAHPDRDTRTGSGRRPVDTPVECARCGETPSSEQQAREDLAAGIYRLHVYGIAAPGREYVELMKARYGVEIVSHGCVADGSLLEYNKVMMAFLENKYGKGFNTARTGETTLPPPVQNTNDPMNEEQQAHKDLAAGIYRLHVFGVVAPRPEYVEVMKARYGVEIVSHGCSVDESLLEYNKVVVAFLEHKYGKELDPALMNEILLPRPAQNTNGTMNGEQQANKDLAAGIYRLYVFGKAAPRPSFVELMKARYGVEIVSNGCLFDGNLLDYNKVVMAFLEKKYGKGFDTEWKHEIRLPPPAQSTNGEK